MDDNRFQKWTDLMGELREARLEGVRQRIQDTSLGMNPKKLFLAFSNHFANFVSKWWELELESWDAAPPADVKLGIDSLKNELESLIDIEKEKIKEEAADLKEGEAAWSTEEFEASLKELDQFSQDLHGKYVLKIDGLQGKGKKEMGKASDSPTRRSGKSTRTYSHGSAGGFWLLFMFGLGALLGAAPTIYYWDLARKTEERTGLEMTQLRGDRKSLLAKLSALQEAYRELALGQTKTIPQLEQSLEPIRRSFSNKREELEREYIRKQAEFIKKIPAGDRLDKALKNLKETQERQRAAYDAEEERQLEPILKELKKHKTILEGGE